MINHRFAVVFVLALLPRPATPQEGSKKIAIIGLRAEEPDVPKEIEGIGLLYREVVRQAVLIAGREGLGLPTRDQALREGLPDGPGTLSLHVKATRTQKLQLSLTQGEDQARKTIWEKTLDRPPSSPCPVRGLVPLIEPLSRGEIVEALRKAGFEGTAVKMAGDQPVPEEAERRLGELTFTEPYAALRILHAACRETGESPARLGALVRAYANLGQLTRGFWNASPKAFAARSLLYADRLLAAAPATRSARWHRAYACTMAGLYRFALEDLEAASGIADSKEVPPPWVAWLTSCCKSEIPILAPGSSAEERALQSFLSYLVVEACGSPAYERRCVLEALKANPDSYRLIDAWCEIGGISNLHQATVTGPGILGASLYRRLEKQAELPKRVREAMRPFDGAGSEFAIRTLVCKELIDSVEPIEPSFTLLGRMIEETSFLQTYRRGDFMRYHWGVPCDEFLKETLPLVKDHPYSALIRSYGLDRDRQPREWAAIFEKMKVVDATEKLEPLSQATWNLAPQNPVGRMIWESMWRHLDATGPDLGWVLRRVSGEGPPQRQKFAGLLIQVSPYSPAAIAELVQLDWVKMAPRALDLEKVLSRQPTVLHALGAKYHELKLAEDAERCFKKEIELAPSLDASRALAEVYRDEGNITKWQKTLEAFLEGEDVGLQHAQVRVELSQHFMKAKEFAKAEPYAAAAAQTWAAWAMENARDCYEGLQKWKEAELWQRRTSERYDEERMEWFFWCKRHQKGDVAAAQDLAMQQLLDVQPRATPGDFQRFGIFYSLCGKPREALSAFRKSLEATNNPWDGLHVALLAMSLKDAELRDSTLQRVIEKGGEFEKAKGDPGLEIELAKQFRDLLELGEGASPNAGIFEAILDRASHAGHRANAAYFMGRFLELQHLPAQAKPYYEDCLKTGQSLKWNYLLSKDALGKTF